MPLAPAAGREAAIAGAIARFPGEQWGWWDLGSDLEERLRVILESSFDQLFNAGPDGFTPRYTPRSRNSDHLAARGGRSILLVGQIMGLVPGFGGRLAVGPDPRREDEGQRAACTP
jgi:hypothetical protein